MKNTTLSSLALAAFLALGAPATVLAAPTALDSTGTVKVEEGVAGGGDTPTVDPENPEKPLPDPDPESPGENENTDKGSLIVEKTTNLEFGTVKTSADAVTAFAKPLVFTDPDNAETKIRRGNYVQWADVRAGGKYGYTITAQLTQQFTGTGNNKLTASTIDFSNGSIVSQGDNKNVIPSNIATGFQLTEAENDAKTVVTADKVKKEGKGRYIMSFGKSNADLAKDTTDKSIKLTIPAVTASNMAVDTYTAKVTWKIVAAPEEAPEG
ncbi:WxL domain-containing protein [Enterococcus rivorum]|uniref:WxL domain-containing protein n=2 Tax=Enterococcus rivorum TaxID=762845 RepID=A0A1E5KXL3_9ENTE|nr:WxL domain-containing protein [Enterococcus rivorum]MBP2099891.1 hypothetical protein [Enterococcus rivorum]OEH82573.1 hypothetical protein BCR26_13055 [Enterococcus rivorum]